MRNKISRISGISFFLLFITSVSFSANPEKKQVPDFDEVMKHEGHNNLFQSGDMFFGGQPNLETLEWLNGQGVDLIINLRTEKENEAFANSSFNEQNVVEKLGVKYVSLPIDGVKSYSPENLKLFAEALANPYNKVFIHCASCGRVSYFTMAYLIKYHNYSLNDAIAVGRKLKFTFPLENLIDEEVSFEVQT